VQGKHYQRIEWIEEIELKRKEKHDLDYEHIFGVKRSTKTIKEVIHEKHSHCWMLKDVKEGLIPKVLAGMLAKRKDVKKLMEAAKKAGKWLEYNVYNARQNAIKVSCNSYYGTLGAQDSGKVSLV